MVYKCSKCEAELNDLPKGQIRCPSCANKIFFKQRSPIKKEITLIQ